MIYNNVLLFLLVVTVNGIPLDQFFPFNGSKLCLIDAVTGLIHIESKDTPGLPSSRFNGSSCSEFSICPNDDSGSHHVHLSFAFPFYGKHFRRVYINTNGIISFTSLVPTFSPYLFPLRTKFLIAPFWADVDTRGTGEIYFKETSDPTLLKKANSIIQRATHQATGLSRFKPKWMLIVTWYKVGYFSQHVDKVNTFQALLVTNEVQSFVVFNYLDDGINWSKGDASLIPAQVGFNFGDLDNLQKFTLPNSGTQRVSDIVMESNTNNPGQFVFRVDDGVSNKTCSLNTDHLVVDPDTPSIINGGVMKLSGPCFGTNSEVITCMFYDASKKKVHNKPINGIITINDKGNEKAICPMPFFKTLGGHSVVITDVNGTMYRGSFTVVPAVYKEPDIKIFKGNDTTESVFIEKDIEYRATWDPEILNIDEFNEGGSISFDFENWIFGLQNKWVDRKTRRSVPSDFLKYTKETTTGIITFSQSIGNLVGTRFDISILLLIKKTKNLKISYTSTLLSFVPGQGIISFCQQWHKQTNEKLYTSDIISCPCNLKSAVFDDDYEPDPTCSVTKTECRENINANHCYLRNIKGKTIGQQCCYDSNGEYTTNGKSAGSADYYYPMREYLRHQVSDYIPYRACCVDSDDITFCNDYYEIRPPHNSSQCQNNDNKKGYADGYGDPHFITLDGKQYTFNGLGEYTLLNALDGEFVIHIQTKQAVDLNGRDLEASVISAIAMKQKNKPTVQAHLHDVLGIEVIVESESNSDGYNKSYLDYVPTRHFDGGQVSIEAKKFSRVFHFENGVVVIVKAANDILSFQLSIPKTFYDNTKGLLGTWNGKQEDDFLRPDGTTVAADSTDELIFYLFGEKWRVDEKDSLIITVRNAPATTKTRSSTYVPLLETPSVDATTSALITETCGDNTECAYDIAVTGNVEVGRETMRDTEEHMMIINQTLPIVCDPPCQNGAPCIANDTCNCNTGFTGPTCAGKIIKCEKQCQNGGTCIGLELCRCTGDFDGQHCTIKVT